jgi:hypothetical protein
MTILLQDQSDKSHHDAISRLEFFLNNLHGVMLWPLKHCFRGKTEEDIFILRKLC